MGYKIENVIKRVMKEDKTMKKNRDIIYILAITLTLLLSACSNPEKENVSEQKASSATEETAGGPKTETIETGAADTETEVGETVPASGEEKTEGAYGRILFVGDSRTIDMFYDSDENIYGEMHDGIAVYGGHGRKLDFMKEAVSEYGYDNFDTLVSWMGANEAGSFEGYGEFYEDVMSHGKNLVVCTVGPTNGEFLDYEYEGPHYLDDLMSEYNDSLTRWAAGCGVRVIDLYRFIKDSKTVTLDPVDGIHYLPRPTLEVWEHILEQLEAA